MIIISSFCKHNAFEKIEFHACNKSNNKLKHAEYDFIMFEYY